MKDEHILFGSMVALFAFVFLMICIDSAGRARAQAVQDLIAKGVKPLEARCAIYGPDDAYMRELCIVVARGG